MFQSTWARIKDLEMVGGLEVATRVEQGLARNKVRHDEEGSHVVTVSYYGSSELTLSAWAEIDPDERDLDDETVEADLLEVVEEFVDDDDLEDDILLGVPDGADVRARSSEPLRTLVYPRKDGRRWDLPKFTLCSTDDDRHEREFVLHRSHEDCRGGREHTVRLSVRATTVFPGIENDEHVDFLVHCKPVA